MKDRKGVERVICMCVTVHACVNFLSTLRNNGKLSMRRKKIRIVIVVEKG